MLGEGDEVGEIGLAVEVRIAVGGGARTRMLEPSTGSPRKGTASWATGSDDASAYPTEILELAAAVEDAMPTPVQAVPAKFRPAMI